MIEEPLFVEATKLSLTLRSMSLSMTRVSLSLWWMPLFYTCALLKRNRKKSRREKRREQEKEIIDQ